MTRDTDHSSRASAAGMTLVELLIASLVLMVVTGAAFLVVAPAQGALVAQLATADVHQRARVAMDMLEWDLVMAGAGIDHAFAPVLPHRAGWRGGEVGVFHQDVISLLAVPQSAAQGRLRVDGQEALALDASMLALEWRPYCGPFEPLCGFAPNMQAAIYGAGSWDLITVRDHQGETLRFGAEQPLASRYRSGAHVAHIRARTYYLKANQQTGTSQLMQYDGFRSDLPLVDDIVTLAFEYFGDPQPPRIVSVEPGGAARTTYGPSPPAAGEDDPHDAWGPGENCLFALVDGQLVPRLPTLSAAGLVAFGPATLTDGPWCPDRTHARRFDADLLRIRRVRVVLRVRAAGSAAAHQVPDFEIRMDVSPRNLQAGAP